MQNNHSYNRWTWIVAALLALLLLWMLLVGHGSSATCCTAGDKPPAVATTAAVDRNFKFNASGSDFRSSGDSTNITWLSKTDALKFWLSKGGDWEADGSASAVALTGTVSNEDAKQQASKDASEFFGAEVGINNQLIVKTAEVGLTTAPSDKVYFATGSADFKEDQNVKLAPIINWLKSHETSKAILSGYADKRGSQTSNELLAKNRAKSVRTALTNAGIDESRMIMRKTSSIEDTDNLSEARHVDITIE